MLFHRQSCCSVVGFRHAAEEHGGAWVWSGISHGPWFALCRRSSFLPRKKQVVGELGQVISVGVCRADCLTSTNLMLILSVTAGRSSSHLNQREKEEKVEMVTKGGGASLLLLAFETLFACNASEEKSRYFGRYFYSLKWNLTSLEGWSGRFCSSQSSTVCTDNIYSACFSNT